MFSAGGDYQLCSDCVKLPTEQHAYPSNTHTLQHNMYLLKAPITNFQSQLLRLRRDTIANAVPRHDADCVKEPGLEEVAVTPKTGGACEAEAESDAVSKKIVLTIVENCTECNKELPGEFFACKTCSGELVMNFAIQPADSNASAENHEPLILCDKCAFKPDLTSIWYHSYAADHFLVLVRNRNVSYIHGESEPEPAPKTKEESEDEPTIKSLQAQMSKMLELIEEMRTSLAALTRPAP